MSGDFLDTNILIYLFDDTAPEKRDTAQALIRSGLDAGTAVISHQVVQETLNVMTRKLAVPASPEQARKFMDTVLTPLWRIMPSVDLYRRGLELQARYRYSFYDSLIIAAALEAGCHRLYSEDLQNGARIEGLTITNPFDSTRA